MKLLVFSDSHGNQRSISNAVAAHPNADALIFLGDGLREAEKAFTERPDIPNITVRGNCDWYGEGTPDETTVDFDGIRILCMHGHKYDVKFTFSKAVARGKEKSAGIILFGHTHEPLDTVIDGIHLFNPGSVGYGKTYGVIYLEKGAVVCSHGKAD